MVQRAARRSSQPEGHRVKHHLKSDRQPAKRMDNSRRTLAKRIRELASSNLRAAMLLAKNGREIADIERQLDLYFEGLNELHQLESGKKTRYQVALEAALETSEEAARKVAEQNALARKSVDRDRARFCQTFIAAMDARDSEKFFEVGIALERLKERDTGDPQRYSILLLKRIAELTGSRLTAKEVADFVGWPEQHQADGFAQLRRLCKELGYRLAGSKPAEE